jgi:hypothetical protein
MYRNQKRATPLPIRSSPLFMQEYAESEILLILTAAAKNNHSNLFIKRQVVVKTDT